MPKLSLADLEGAEVVSTPKPQQRLDAADLEGAEIVSPGRPAKPAVSGTESASRGFGQGATLGFGDELSAAAGSALSKVPGGKYVNLLLNPIAGPTAMALKALGVSTPLSDVDTSGKSYTQRRDELRAQDRAAQEANPKTFAAGEIAGGIATAPLVPGGGAAAPLGKAIVKGALTGAGVGGAVGLGTSEADLTKGEYQRALEDTARGAKVGALTGGAVPLVRPIIKAAAGGANRLISDVTKGKIRPAQALREELGRGVIARGEPALKEVLEESPAARYAVEVQARTSPTKAVKTLNRVLDAATEENDKAYAAIQRQHGGVPLVDVTDRLTRLEAKLNAQGNGVAADATARFRIDLLKRYATSGKVTPDLKVSPQLKLGANQIRTMRNNAEDVAFGGGFKDIAANSRRGATARIVDEINAVIEDVAGNTSKVDVAALKARNRRIATLMPVREALQDRIDLAIDQDRGLYQRAKAIPGNVARSTARKLDYALDRVGTVPPAAAVVPAATTERDRNVSALGIPVLAR